MPRKKEAVEVNFNPAFAPLFQDNVDDARYYQVYGSRGSGKSFAVAFAAVQKTYSPHQHRILYLRQVMSSSEDSTIADVLNAISLMKAEGDFRVKGTTITNKITGSQIIFKGIRSSGSNTAKLKSLSNITTLIIEEAEEIEGFEEFSKIDESIRLAGKPLKIILIYNPGQAMSSWIHKEWFIQGEPRKDRLDDTVFIHSTYLDNIENLHPSTVARYEKLKETNPIYYRNTILAEWTLDAANRIYAGWDLIDRFDKIGDVWYGLDFGYGGKDKTSCIKINYVDEIYYVSEVFSEAKLSMRATATKLRKAGVPFNAKIYADSSVPILLDEMRVNGYRNIRKAKKGSVDAGIKKMQDKDIIIVGGKESNKNLYYSYKTFARDAKDNRPHEPDELAALRYGIISKRPLHTPKKEQRIKPKRKGIKFKGYI